MLNLVSAETRLQTAFQDDVIRGLSRTRKSIPCRWLYDERGSEIFEKITLLDDYYPTRTETAILRANADDIATFTAHTATLIEFGAGSGINGWRVAHVWKDPDQSFAVFGLASA